MPRDYSNVQVATICSECGQLFAGEGDRCEKCLPDYGADASHEAVKLFEPGPAPMQGQEFMDI
jgi:tRNA(Ile2) C34 agmatinyltransferase TiaS